MFRAAEKGASLAAACPLREGALGLPCTPSRAGWMGPRFHLHVGSSAPAPQGTQPGGYHCHPARAVWMPACPVPTVWGWQHWSRPGAEEGLSGHQGGGQRVGSCYRSPWPPLSCRLPPAPSARHHSLGVAQAGFCSHSVGLQHRPGLKGGGPASPRCSREAGARCEGRRRPGGGGTGPLTWAGVR